MLSMMNALLRKWLDEFLWLTHGFIPCNADKIIDIIRLMDDVVRSNRSWSLMRIIIFLCSVIVKKMIWQRIIRRWYTLIFVWRQTWLWCRWCLLILCLFFFFSWKWSYCRFDFKKWQIPSAPQAPSRELLGLLFFLLLCNNYSWRTYPSFRWWDLRMRWGMSWRKTMPGMMMRVTKLKSLVANDERSQDRSQRRRTNNNMTTLQFCTGTASEMKSCRWFDH